MSTHACIAYIDGGARGNPGPAGYGVRVEQPDGTLVDEFHESIGRATNNVAEYRGLLAALEYAVDHGCRDLTVRSDSLLLVKQMHGEYRVKNPGLQPLHQAAQGLVARIGRVRFEHVGRGLNAHADRLANEAMDEAEVKPTNDKRKTKNTTLNTEKTEPGTRPDQAAQLRAADDLYSPVERAVRLFVYRHFVETTAAPTIRTIASAVGANDEEVNGALRRLADTRALVLAPASLNIWMAHPFSAVPTSYPVVAGGWTYWANCAWDAAGVLSLIGGEGETKTQCADCGADQSMAVRDGQLVGDGVVHYAVPPRRFWENVAFT